MSKLALFKSATCLLLTGVPRKLTWHSYASYNAPPIKIKIVPVSPVIPQTYIDKNKDLKRALSPNLSIYKVQLTSMMSISLRMTGLAVSIMTWAVFLTAYFSEQNVDYFVNLLENLELDECYWTSAKTLLVFPFAFHVVAGIRHLMFDTSKLLEKKHFYATGYAAILLAFALALFLVMIEDVHEKYDEILDEEYLKAEEK